MEFSSSSDTFGWIDYLVFSLMLMLSVSIGLFYGCFQKKENTEDFLMAGRSMSVFPVVMSLIASFMSSVTLLGVPAEIYTHGAMFWLFSLSFFISIPLGMTVFLPVFWDLRLTSVHLYLELRFNKAVKFLGTTFCMVYMTIYMAIVTYGPALALAHTMNMNVHACVVLITVICIFYTSIGGLKAVLWSDVLQLTVMYGSILVIIIKGTLDLGGFQRIWQIGTEGKRTDLFDFDFHPHKRHTVWSILIGGGLTWVGVYGLFQAQVQRYLCLKSKTMLRKTMMYTTLGNALLVILCSYLGLMLYANYWQCDPIIGKMITKKDQILPLFVMESFGKIPGLPGLFVAGIFSGTLSSVSSGLNSLSTIFIEDVLKDDFVIKISEKWLLRISRILTVVFGIGIVAFVYIVEQIGSIVTAVYVASSATVGPQLGLFTLGTIFPFVNSMSAFCSAIVGMATFVFISASQIYAQNNNLVVPSVLEAGQCGNWTLEDMSSRTEYSWIPSNQVDENVMSSIYKISYMWITSIAFIVMIVTAILMSFVTGRQNIRKLNPN